MPDEQTHKADNAPEIDDKSALLVLRLWLQRFLTEILSIREGADIQATTEGIKRDITFKGPTVWILMFSILIASIGLNANSPAVIIGAMLISPLMGPILGIGLSIGTNDFVTLFKSLKNIAVAVAISIATSTIYFVLSPLNVEQSELLARTNPTILDVLIAFFGGAAGIIAGSRKEKSNVIPGVAIATALMPPLCTAGYGIATLNWQYFLGAFYLYFINSVFISLSTFLVVRYLKFPVLKYLDPLKIKKYKLYFILFLIITVTPSTIMFWNVIQETRFKISAETFIDRECRFDHSELINYRLEFNDTLSYIHLYYLGQLISDGEAERMEDQLAEYGLKNTGFISTTRNTKLHIHQSGRELAEIESRFERLDEQIRIGVLEDIYKKTEQSLQYKDERIAFLENQVFHLSKRDTIPMDQIRKELQFQYPGIEAFAWSKVVSTPVQAYKADTVPVVMIRKSRRAKVKNNDIEKWLKVRLNLDTLLVVEY